MSEYKFEKEIIGSIHTAEDRYAIDKEDYEGFEKQREELSEVYNKAESWDAYYITVENDIENVAKKIKEYKAAGLDTSDYEFSQGILLSVKEVLDKLLESGDSEC